MGLTFAENTRPFCRNYRNSTFGAVLLFAVWLTGCNNTCFSFISNPPTGTLNIKVSNPVPACTLTKANGAIRLMVKKIPICSSCLESSRVQHIFLSIRSIEANVNTADDDLPDWQELLPAELVKQPLQVDLVSDPADQSAREPLGEIATVPAGTYRQLRVRFLPNQPMMDDRLPEKNACGTTGFNCVVMADGRIQPLLLGGAVPELRITPDRIEGGSLLVPPDTNTDLVIELNPVWAWFSSADEGLRLLPALTGSASVGRIESGGLALSSQ
jgi:hypothetical protein